MARKQKVQVTHRVEELRRAHGLSQSELGAAIGRDKSIISRIESGGIELDLKTAREIADVFHVDVSEVLALTASATPGLSEDLHPYKPDVGDPPLQIPKSPNRYLYVVDSDACQNAGIRRGDIVEIDDSAKAVREVQPLDVVMVLYHASGAQRKAMQLLRQFVPPGLLITNNGPNNARSIETAHEDAHIVGVVVGVPRRAKVRGTRV